MSAVAKYLLAGFVLFFTGCAHKTVNKTTLLSYLQEDRNGTSGAATVNGVRYKVTFRPNDLIIEHELKAKPGYNKDSLRTVYSDCLYFVLTISQDSTEIFGRLSENYETLLRQVSFGMKELVTLKENRDNGSVFFLADYVYPRMYGSTGGTSVLLCFQDPGLKQLKEFTIEVKDFLGQSGEYLRFRFLKQDLDHIPDLKL